MRGEWRCQAGLIDYRDELRPGLGLCAAGRRPVKISEYFLELP